MRSILFLIVLLSVCQSCKESAKESEIAPSFLGKWKAVELYKEMSTNKVESQSMEKWNLTYNFLSSTSLEISGIENTGESLKNFSYRVAYSYDPQKKDLTINANGKQTIYHILKLDGNNLELSYSEPPPPVAQSTYAKYAVLKFRRQ